MTSLVYTPRGMPTQLLKDLLDTYWDTRSGNIVKPVIIEKPPPDYQRADIRNSGDHVLVSLEGQTTEYISVAFQHIARTINLDVQLNVFTSRQRFYDSIDEIERIIFSKQFDPTDQLLDGFEGYANTAATQAVWGDTTTNSTISLLESARKYGTNSMRVVVGGGGNGESYRALPTSVPDPYPRRLQQIRFFAKIDSSSDVIGVTLRQSTNRSGHYRTWNATIDSTNFKQYIINIDQTATSSAGTWDPTTIDEIAFTNLAANRTFDIDHIDLATNEYQFLQFNSFRENVDTFNYFSGNVKCSYRSHGEPVDTLA